MVGAELVLVPEPVEEGARDDSSPRTPPTRPSPPGARAATGCARIQRAEPEVEVARPHGLRRVAHPFPLKSMRPTLSANRADHALYLCLTAHDADPDLPSARAAGAAADAAVTTGREIAQQLGDRPAHRPPLHRGAAGARHPRRGAARRRRRLPHPARLPAAAADAERRRGRRRRARADGCAPARARSGTSRRRRSAREDPPRAPGAAAHARWRRSRRRSASPRPRPAARPVAATRRCCWPTRSGGGGGCASPTGRSRASRAQRELSPLGLVVHAGRWYLAAHDHGRDDLRTFRVDRMTACGVADRPALAPRRTASTRSRTSASRSPACPGRGRSRCCSTSPSRRGRGRPPAARSPS